jgi:hypothetical protein
MPAMARSTQAAIGALSQEIQSSGFHDPGGRSRS